MTPKEKAKELVNKYWITDFDIYEEESKVCALIAVDEIIKELTIEISPSLLGFRYKYWQEVKEEIEKL